MEWPFPIVQSLHSSAAIVFGREVYSDDAGWFIDKTHDVFRACSNILWWFRYRLIKKHKHHIVYTKLKPGYWCEDTRLFEACMKCLEDHVQSEGGEEEFVRWTEELLHDGDNYDQGKRQLEVLTIYRWYKYEKPKDEKLASELLELVYRDRKANFIPYVDSPEFHEYRLDSPTAEQDKAMVEMEIVDKKIEDDEQTYLHRLIDIRRTLWT